MAEMQKKGPKAELQGEITSVQYGWMEATTLL